VQLTTALAVAGHGLDGGHGKDLGRGVLGSDHDVALRVGRRVAGEDGGIDDEEVVGAVDLGVKVNDSGAAVAAVIRADLVGAHPVVGAAVAGLNEHL